jgi:hypothetical protein
LAAWGLAVAIHTSLPDDLTPGVIEVVLAGPAAVLAFAVFGDDWPFMGLSFDAFALIGSGCFYAFLGLVAGAYFGRRRERAKRKELVPP